MKRFLQAAGLVLLLGICVGALRLQKLLPPDRAALVADKYAGWSGVLRIWVCEGLPGAGGSVAGWVNRCAAAFERAHKGVYIQVTTVDIAAVQQMHTTGINPPDAVLFTQGTFDNGLGFVPLYVEYPVRSDILRAGQWQNLQAALPVAMGIHAWAYRADALPAIPATWENSAAVVVCPEDSKGALLALCSGMRSADSRTGPTDITLPGLDIGLAMPGPQPSPTPLPTGNLIYCKMNDLFHFSDTCYADFINGKVQATVIDQQQLYKLKALQDAGKGPDWEIAVTGDVLFADSVVMYGVVNTEKNNAQQRQQLCAAFGEHLTDRACQEQLACCGLFSVTGCRVYSTGTFAQAEESIHGKSVLAPNAFNNSWQAAAELAATEYVRGACTANEALNDIAQLFDLSTDIYKDIYK